MSNSYPHEQGDYSWIQKDPLSRVFAKLVILQSEDANQINGIILGFLAKRMLGAEDQIGGPYSDGDTNKIELNKSIDLFFTKLGAPLPNVRTFLLKEVANMPRYDKDMYQNFEKNVIESNPISLLVKTEIMTSDFLSSNIMLKIWNSISAFDTHREITHLAKYFAEALILNPNVSEDIFEVLGIANFYAWMAYSIYDDIIDGEDKSTLLPTANILQRQALSKYLQVVDFNLISTSFNEVDEGNLQELNTYRFVVRNGIIALTSVPNYKDGDFIAKCAIGHTLGPMIILKKYTFASAAQKTFIKKGFVEYLIARQLNDDAHDWVEDLKKGQLSLVLVFLLEKINITPGNYKINTLIKNLKYYFWELGLEEITSMTTQHIKKSKEYFLKSGLLVNENVFFKEILDPINNAALQGSKNLKNQKDFYKAFSK